MHKHPSNQFKVSVPVKPYVKVFLETNFGSPVEFTTSEDNKFFRNLLKRLDSRDDKKYPDVLHHYTETVEVLISEDTFYRYGWELTKTGIVNFGLNFENRAKTMMRTWVGVMRSVGFPQNTTINNFQERFLFSENEWSYDTIKKDMLRNGFWKHFGFDFAIFDIIHKIVLENLYKKGTISKKGLNVYENS